MNKTDFGTIWQSKIRTLQKRLDLNKDGELTKDDFVTMVSRFGSIGKATSDQVKQIQTVLFAMWDQYLAPAAALGPITGDAYIAALKSQGKQAISKTVFQIYQQFFIVIDRSGRGSITLSDLEVYFQVMEIDVAYAKVAFKDMDDDNDGYVSQAEYLFAVDKFYCSEKTSSLWGPLDGTSQSSCTIF